MVKCNMQTDPKKFPSISKGFGITVREQGYSGLVRGWVPTLLGYSVQGAGKFGLYEYFKKCVYSNSRSSAKPCVVAANSGCQTKHRPPAAQHEHHKSAWI